MNSFVLFSFVIRFRYKRYKIFAVMKFFCPEILYDISYSGKK